MRRWRSWVLIASVLMAIIVAIPLTLGLASAKDHDKQEQPDTQADQGQWYRVERKSFDLEINASGELEAKDQIEVKSNVRGRPEIISIVKEGTTVSEGDLLVKLDREELQEQLESYQLSLANAQASFIKAEQSMEIQQNDAESARKKAEVALVLAELELEKWRNGTVPQKKRELQLALEKSQRRVARAKRDLELSEQLHEQEFISDNELEDAQIELIEAHAAEKSALLDVDVFNKYTYETDRRKKTSDLEQAEAELDRTKRKNISNLAQREAELINAKRTLAIRKEAVTEVQQQLEETNIYAPSDGLVVYSTSTGSRWHRSNPMAAGRAVRFNETIIYLPDTRQMVAVLRVHEAMIPQVEIGQPVYVTIDARPGQIVQGKVTHISTMAEDAGWANPQLREYLVRVELPNGLDTSLKPAMLATGRIVTGNVEDALAVPVQAVMTEGEEHFVYVPSRGERVRRQTVKIGRSSETMVEILSGVSAGDLVLLRQPRPGELVG